MSEISAELFTLIFRTLQNLLLEDLRTGIQVPTFEGTRLSRGVVRTTCDTIGGREWLLGVVGRLSTAVGVPLTAMSFSEVPRLLFNAFFPYTNLEWGDIETLLKAVNTGLSPVNFSCIYRKVGEKGVHLLLSTRPSDKDIVMRNGPRFKFGMGKAFIKFRGPTCSKGPFWLKCSWQHLS